MDMSWNYYFIMFYILSWEEINQSDMRDKRNVKGVQLCRKSLTLDGSHHEILYSQLVVIDGEYSPNKYA